MLPVVDGRPIRVEIRRSLGAQLAACSLQRRIILLDREVLDVAGDFERILVHEIFHFVWRRLGNPARREWERVLLAEIDEDAQGELGWSSEWRKTKLKPRDLVSRNAKWKRYACESFCDTAAWRFAGLRSHEEFTLDRRFRSPRRRWFERSFPATRAVPI